MKGPDPFSEIRQQRVNLELRGNTCKLARAVGLYIINPKVFSNDKHFYFKSGVGGKRVQNMSPLSWIDREAINIWQFFSQLQGMRQDLSGACNRAGFRNVGRNRAGKRWGGDREYLQAEIHTSSSQADGF